MTCTTAQFNRLDRGYNRDMVLIPGWATDVRIFEPLFADAASTSSAVVSEKAGIHLPVLPYNIILPTGIVPETFADDLHHWLSARNLQNVSLLGWSMGGFLAAELAGKFPSQVHELFLLSVRQTFDPQSLDDIRQLLEKDRRAYLYGFYLQCFRHCSREIIAQFKRTLLKPYLECMTLPELLRGLDYLARTKIDTTRLSAIPAIHFLHGLLDEITPVTEAQNLASAISGASFHCYPNLGHLIFYDSAFREGFNE
ncbi:MAG: alpha/beta hydrolase [Phycisphaerae bacterium]|jgi:pimeloyl-ACP methyl ester carboxylesterase|nr:alpha/beta hydrolase [Phycisphaerae bacterium]